MKKPSIRPVAGSTSDRTLPCRRRVANLYLLQDEQEAYLFDKSAVSVWPVSAKTASVLSAFLSGASCLPEDAASWSVAEPILEEMLRHPTAFPKAFTFLDGPTVDKRDSECVAVLSKLSINVANDCNLRCSYCYANHGEYQSTRGLLRPDDAVAYAERFVATYAIIDQVQFMGGEPTMNVSAISAVVDCFERAVTNGRLIRLPAYKVVTNAVRLSSEFLHLCSRHSIELTVSLDGPSEVHDSVRVRSDGSGSYALVRQGIAAAQEAGLRIGFEPTFSRAHLRAGMSLIELCRWFHTEFGVRILHAPPMSMSQHSALSRELGLSTEQKVEQYCKITQWGIRNIIDKNEVLLHDYTARILVSLSGQERNDTLCPAGFSQLSVSMSGEISPCWMFTDEPGFELGNVIDREKDLLSERGRRRLDRLRLSDLQQHQSCRRCAIQPLCFGCKGSDFLEAGVVDGKPNCDYMRAMVFTCFSESFKRQRTESDSRSDALSTNKTFGERLWRLGSS